MVPAEIKSIFMCNVVCPSNPQTCSIVHLQEVDSHGIASSFAKHIHYKVADEDRQRSYNRVSPSNSPGRHHVSVLG